MKKRKAGMNMSLIILATILFTILSHHLYTYADQFSSSFSFSSFPPPPPFLLSNSSSSPLSLSSSSLSAISSSSLFSLSTTKGLSSSSLSTVAILIPDWQVLVLVSPETPPSPAKNYTCVFPNNSSSPARFAGDLPFRRGTVVYTCEFPLNNRRRPPFLQPRLISQEYNKIIQSSFDQERENTTTSNLELLLRWNKLAYESFTTEYDVVLLVKGVNNRQGFNIPPSDLRCTFGDDPLTAVRTAVTSSEQEVFRCLRPKLSENSNSRPIRISLEIRDPNGTIKKVVPSVAQYKPSQRRTIEFSEPKSLICACTMVYNVAKFLGEWVTYHSAIGVGKFILYDNDSDDDLGETVRVLNRAGFDVRTVYWPWPKTQEAGFAHCALYAEQICDWIAFVDVDEFILSPTWIESVSKPDRHMLSKALLPKGTNPGRVGQVSIRCNEFGPSNQTGHPPDGVTQGYTCRRRYGNRHKSIVLVDAIHRSLLNVIHHFKLREGYKTGHLGSRRALVNHYKYQAWPEFQVKFRRRVSAYVVDWRQSRNPTSNDRAPGLGFEPVEPKGWAQRFCEVRDERLKKLTRRWFGLNKSGLMAWQSA